MHFSIPETSEYKDINQGNFTVYHLNANGILHCKLRFKQFNSLHEQLKKQFGIFSLPYFPPKKFFNLTEIEIEERRASLEKYMQIISQDERISNSNLFNDFLLNAQQETLNAIRESIKIDVLLGDNSRLNLQIMSTDNSNLVKDTICRELHLPIKYTPYFSLFIVKEETIESNLIESNSTKTFNHLNQQNKHDEQFINSKKYKNQLNCKYILIRKLMDFESPYLSLKNANQDNKIYYLKLIKFYWDINLDDKLIDNEIALNLLYIQTVQEFEKKSTEINKDHYQYLESLALRQSKKEYITFAKCVKGYGLMKFEHCLCDFPKPNTKCQISIRSNELILKTFLNNTNGKMITKEFILRITRIRCWRLTSGLDLKKSKLNTNQTKSNTFLNTSLDNDFKYELSIEYLISKDDLKWIIIKSEQAVLISTCLKSVIEELVLQKNNLPLYEEKSNEISVNLRKNSCNYYKSNDQSLNNSITSIEDDYNLDLVSCNNLMEKSLSETILVTSNKVKFTNCINNQPKNRKLRNLVHNNYYDGIGDDDL